MVEPVSLSLGAITAAMIAKASEKTAERAVDSGAGGLRRLVAWLKKRFSDEHDGEATTALARVEDAPDSPSRLRELADVLEQRMVNEPFRNELATLVAEAQREDVNIGPIVQTAWGHQNVQAAGMINSDISSTFGKTPG